MNRDLLGRNASQRLLAALLANEREEAESLLALGVPLNGTRWPGKFTALHAAALSNCATVLPSVVEAAKKEGIFIDSWLESEGLHKVFPKFFAELGFAEETNFEGPFGDLGQRALPRDSRFVCLADSVSR